MLHPFFARVGTTNSLRAVPRRDSVLDCGSPLPLFLACSGRDSARGLAQSKTCRPFDRFRERFTVRFLRCCALRAACCVFVLANAQPLPKITSVSPDWVQRGATSIVVLEGENLSEVTGFIISGDGGLAATNAAAPARNAILEGSRGGIVPADNDEKRLRVSVTVAPDALLGARELRVAVPSGVSEPVALNVDYLRQITQSGPNQDTHHAQLI